MADVNRGNRPLSPHLQVYRPQLTSVTSIFARITGVALLGAAMLVVIVWKLFEGLEAKHRAGTRTTLLQIPLWWAYLICLSGLGLTALCSLYTATVRIAEAVSGRSFLPVGEGAVP